MITRARRVAEIAEKHERLANGADGWRAVRQGPQRG
jgi:hypothetical protein